MTRQGNTVAALVGAALILIAAVWLDNVVMNRALREAQQSFDTSRAGMLSALGSICVAGGCLAVAWLGTRASTIVGFAYVVVGAFLAALEWIAWDLAMAPNDGPTVLPSPLAQAVNDLWYRTDGPLNAVATIGGAMLIVGAIVIGRAVRRSRVPTTGIVAVAAEPAPR